MTLTVEIQGSTVAVEIEPVGTTGPDGGRFRVRIDGVADDVDARRTELGVSLVFASGRSQDAAVTEQPGGRWLVQMSRVGLVALAGGRRGAPGTAPARDGGEAHVTAPMPGRVIRVLARAGDVVEAGQGLVVVEAMKMENELTSPKAGRVKNVAVSEGMSVEAGRLLVVVH
jgi:biotin carboxyl carrier protein